MTENKVEMKYTVGNIFEAIDANDLEKVLVLICKDKRIVNRADRKGITPLMNAVLGKKYAAIRLLLMYDADVNAKDNDGWTAKSWAMFIQDKESMRILSKISVLSDTDDISGSVFGSMGMF